MALLDYHHGPVARDGNTFEKIVMGFILICGFAVMTWMWTTHEPEPDLQAIVVTQARHYMRDHLIAPTTAKFPWAFPPVYRVKNQPNIYYVSHYVDAQNAFGAMIRTHYKCTVWTDEHTAMTLGCDTF